VHQLLRPLFEFGPALLKYLESLACRAEREALVRSTSCTLYAEGNLVVLRTGFIVAMVDGLQRVGALTGWATARLQFLDLGHCCVLTDKVSQLLSRAWGLHGLHPYEYI